MPLLALVNGSLQYATPDGERRGMCRYCGATMIAKVGSVVIWHWAHDSGSSCPSAGETEWHLGWKSQVSDPARIEVARGNRRADVITTYGWPIEFQHSSLSVDEVIEREVDWDNRLIWVVDARDAYEGGRLTVRQRPGSLGGTVCWRWAPKWVRAARCRTFLDLGDGFLMMVLRWYPRRYGRPLAGVARMIDYDAFRRCVLDGRRPPLDPRFDQPLNPDLWGPRPTDQRGAS